MFIWVYGFLVFVVFMVILWFMFIILIIFIMFYSVYYVSLFMFNVKFFGLYEFLSFYHEMVVKVKITF